MRKLKSRRPSPAMVVAVIALIVALAGTAYAAQTINGGRDQEADDRRRQAEAEDADRLPDQHQQARRGAGGHSGRPTPTGPWSTTRPAPATPPWRGPATPAITATEGGGAVAVTFPVNVSGCANVAGRNNAGTTVPGAGFAQTNTSPANANAIEVRHPRRKRSRRGRRLPPDRRLPIDGGRCPARPLLPPEGPGRIANG